MESRMKLYEFDGGLYPPRVSIYLAEKGIADIDRISFDMFGGWPSPEMERLGPLGTVPVLQTGRGALVRSSMAIIEYLEELYPEPGLLGATPEARANTRVFVSVIEEAALQLGIWCHKGSPIFAGREPQDAVAAMFARDAYHGRLQKLELLASETEGPFLTGSSVTVADCAAMATLQFARDFYGIPVPEDCRRLTAWFLTFSGRPSTKAPVYGDEVRAKARLHAPW